MPCKIKCKNVNPGAKRKKCNLISKPFILCTCLTIYVDLSFSFCKYVSSKLQLIMPGFATLKKAATYSKSALLHFLKGFESQASILDSQSVI